MRISELIDIPNRFVLWFETATQSGGPRAGSLLEYNNSFVRMKFDEGVVYNGIWFGSQRLAYFVDDEAVEYMAKGILNADSVMYEIAGEISTFDFRRSHNDRAVHNLIERCQSLKE